MSNSFDNAESLSDAFLTQISAGLKSAIDVLSGQADVGSLLERSNAAFATLPVSSDLRRSADVQQVAIASLRQHQQALLNRSVDGDTVAEDASIYRRWVEVLSILKKKNKGRDRTNADALLSFELTAEQPSADELDSEDEEVAIRLSRMRSDLRVALLIHDVESVIVLTESEMVQIAYKREAHELAVNQLAPEQAYGSSLLLNSGVEDIVPVFDRKGEFAVGKQILYPQFAARNQYAQAILATIDDMQTTRRRQAPAVIAAAHHYVFSQAQPNVRLRDFNPLEPLMEWHSLSNETLAQIGGLVRKDDGYRELTKIDARQRSDSVVVVTAALRTAQWLAQLVYIASVSGVLAVRIGAIHGYETTLWAKIKRQLKSLSLAVMKALRSSTQLHSDETLKAIVRFDGQCAALFAIAGVLARGITYDAGGERVGINPFVFADSLHAAFDVVAHVAFGLALPRFARE